MARVSKVRRVCAEPGSRRFFPEGEEKGFVTMSMEEFESIRLCDWESLEQDDAAKRMNISRGTFQRILYNARKTTAEALVNGKGIIISGGNYEIASFGCDCQKACRCCRFEKNKQGDANNE